MPVRRRFPDEPYSSPTAFLAAYADELHAAIKSVEPTAVRAAADILLSIGEGSVLACGNGGSAAIANHLCCDVAKGIRMNTGRRVRAISLSSNVPLLSAISNDIGYPEVFSTQLDLVAGKGDVLVAISSSGRSPNVVNALRRARELGLRSIAFTGFDGGPAREAADVSLHVDAANYGVVEDSHQALTHMLAQYVILSTCDPTKIAALAI